MIDPLSVGLLIFAGGASIKLLGNMLLKQGAVCTPDRQHHLTGTRGKVGGGEWNPLVGIEADQNYHVAAQSGRGWKETPTEAGEPPDRTEWIHAENHSLAEYHRQQLGRSAFRVIEEERQAERQREADVTEYVSMVERMKGR
jgi:hypothetical protein